MTRPYGRFFYLPKILAERGHNVVVLLLNYENEATVETSQFGIDWVSASTLSYRKEVRAQIKRTRPDWIVGFSDTYFGILAAHYGRKFGIRTCIDAYDNYESYLPWLKPLHWVWRRALRQADTITAAGPVLIDRMSAGRLKQSSAVVPMAADPVGFQPLNKIESRQLLDLPEDATLVGYSGSLHHSRGVQVFFDAIQMMQKEHPETIFIHSGHKGKDVTLPRSLRSLGYIDDEKMPVLLNCMDTLVVLNRASAFGHYSHPVKLYEAMSCQVPVVATQTLATDWILQGHPDRLVAPDDPQALYTAIARSLRGPTPNYQSISSWQSSCTIFENALINSA